MADRHEDEGHSHRQIAEGLSGRAAPGPLMALEKARLRRR
jgi:hypothetical protein